ncbi:MAG: hypothetical protein M3Z04_13685 [Chloroflexota bacterium]|nr:hypothetical protein [Chloroflexota bacterium]
MDPHDPLPEPDPRAEAQRLLRAMGWDESERAQIRIYAKMPPKVKIAQMLHFRNSQVAALRKRIQHEQPHLTPQEVGLVLRRRLDAIKEYGG